MNVKPSYFAILGGVVALALGAGIGTLIGKTDEPAAEFGSAPKSLTEPRTRVPVPALPTAAAIPALHTVTVETTETAAPEEGEFEGEEEGGSEPFEEEVIQPEEETKQKVEPEPQIKEPAPHPTVTIGKSE